MLGIETIPVSYYNNNGKRRVKYFSTGLPEKGNKRKAEAELARIRSEFAPPQEVGELASDMPFADYLLEWLDIVKVRVKATTFSSYEQMVKSVIEPYFRKKALMENIIYNELLCRGYSVDVGVVEIVEQNEGKKTKKQCEIDFVVNVGAKKYYIQSALNVSESSKMEAELRPLKNTKDFFKKIIVSKTQMKAWTDEDGILHLGLYEFLLNESSLEL